jgi:hypothetical protein
MLAIFKRPMFQRTATWLAILLISLAVLPLSAQAVGAPQSPAAANNASPIPFDQIGVEADKQPNGSDLGIKATADGA